MLFILRQLILQMIGPLNIDINSIRLPICFVNDRSVQFSLVLSLAEQGVLAGHFRSGYAPIRKTAAETSIRM
jgi:hypothetical protein